MKRGRIEVLADIVHSCPGLVYEVIMIANTHWYKVKDAHDLGLVEMELRGKWVKSQTVVSTDKGLELYRLIKRARKLCQK